MSSPPQPRRGRPPKPDVLTPAERMRRYRQRKRNAGQREATVWLSAAPAVYSDHQRLEARSLAMHCRMAQKLLKDPALLAIARTNLSRWKKTAPQPLPSYFAEWEQILERNMEEIGGFMVQQSADAVRLRQSSPFAGLLTREEREQIYMAFR